MLAFLYLPAKISDTEDLPEKELRSRQYHVLLRMTGYVYTYAFPLVLTYQGLGSFVRRIPLYIPYNSPFNHRPHESLTHLFTASI